MKHGRAGMFLAILQHALYDPTAILVGRQFMNVACKGVDDELDMFSGYPFESFLDHMVSVLILDAFENVVLKFSNQLGLLTSQDMFQSLRHISEKQKRRHPKGPTFCTTRQPYIWQESTIT